MKCRPRHKEWNVEHRTLNVERRRGEKKRDSFHQSAPCDRNKGGITYRLALSLTNRFSLVDGMVAVTCSVWASTGVMTMVTPPVPWTAGVHGGARFVLCSMTWVTPMAASLRL